MKVYHFSDTHSLESTLQLPDLSDVRVMVFSGDESNYRDVETNMREFYQFVEWYGNVPFYGEKLMIAGNHSSAIFNKSRDCKRWMIANNIVYLEDEEITINQVKFYGSPRSPNFGNWFFMSDRNKIHKYWDAIPEDTNVLITHTPPKGKLDLSVDRDGNLEMCGCSNLSKRVKQLPALKANLFGHIHNSRYTQNFGILHQDGIIYSNATCVRDGDFKSGIINHGNIIEI